MIALKKVILNAMTNDMLSSESYEFIVCKIGLWLQGKIEIRMPK